MSIPYMIGRRTIAKTATFGAGAVLGWAATRKSSAPEPEDAVS